jgi:hypothetical protein
MLRLPLRVRQQEMFVQLLCSMHATLRNLIDLPRLRGGVVPGMRIDQPVLLLEGMPVHLGMLIKA